MTTTPDEATEAPGQVPAPRSGGPPARRAPLAVAAAVPTAWAALVSPLPVLAVVLFAQVAPGAATVPAGQVVRVALAGWLLAHGAGLHTPTGTLALAPLLFTAVA